MSFFDRLQVWNEKSEEEQAQEGLISKLVGEAFGHDGDGKGFGDFVYDLSHAEGGNDANQGAAGWLELTQEQGSAVANTVLDVGQAVGTGVLNAYGMGELAGGINSMVDQGQSLANRQGLEDKYGEKYVSALDTIASFIVQYGWSMLLSMISVLTSDGFSTYLKSAGLTASVIRSKWSKKQSDLYRLYPNLWTLKDAPPTPYIGSGIANTITSSL